MTAPLKMTANGPARMVSGTDVIDSMFLPVTLLGKNYLVNPRFDFWQAGTSSSVAGYLADQWFNNLAGNVTFSQTTLSNGMYGLTWTTGSSSSVGSPGTCLERAEVIPLRGQRVTFSIYLSSPNLSGNMGIYVYYSTSTDARASQTTLLSSITTIAITSTLSRYSFSFDVPTTALGLLIYVQPVALQASGVSVTHAMAQLEIGTIATPFDTLPYPLELLRCQRFYEIGYAGCHGYSPSASGQYIGSALQFVPKRVVPTIGRISTVSSLLTNGAYAQFITTSSSEVVANCNSSGCAWFWCSWSIDARL